MITYGVTRLGDKNSGHGCCFTPTPLITASPNVFINGKPCGRSGDHYAEHGGCVEQNHKPDIDYLVCSHNVLVNGRSIAVVGDPTDKGSYATIGSPNVLLVRR